MLEMLINPKKAERHPWELFFIGAFYASLAVFITEFAFRQDPVLSKYSGILIVTFTVMFSIPFIYYTIRLEESKISPLREEISLLREHKKAIYAFLFLFLGFVVAFSFWYSLLSTSSSFNAQIETFCQINRPAYFSKCVSEYSSGSSPTTGSATAFGHLAAIFQNNLYVSLFTLIFSLVFGAGVIFILAWNASVIAAAIGIFTNSNINSLPYGLARYLIHGIPEIAAYFVIALAGGLISISVIRHEAGTEKFQRVLKDSFTLILVGLGILFIAAIIEAYVTPLIF